MKRKWVFVICVALLLAGIGGGYVLSDIVSTPKTTLPQLPELPKFPTSDLFKLPASQSPNPSPPSSIFKDIYLNKAESYQKQADDYLSGAQLWQGNDSEFGRSMYQMNMDSYLEYQSKANEYILKSLQD